MAKNKLYIPFYDVLKSFLITCYLVPSWKWSYLSRHKEKRCRHGKQRINCICLELLMWYLRQAHICLMWTRIWPNLNPKKWACFCVSALQSDSHKNFSNLFVFYGWRPYLLRLNMVCLGWNVARWTTEESQICNSHAPGKTIRTQKLRNKNRMLQFIQLHSSKYYPFI